VNNPESLDSGIAVYLQHELPLAEVAEVIKFLEKKHFCVNGQTVMACIFILAEEYGIPVVRVTALVNREYEAGWKFQPAGLRGDPDAPGAVGIQTRASFGNICDTLGIPNPALKP
jgi:hypothetical protein